MKTIDIGRNGNQSFPIGKERERVNGLHARITIDDQGNWYVEDLNSANGTFILNEFGNLVQVRKKLITEYTRIVLADTTPMGFSFIAHHVLEADPGNYRAEFNYLLSRYQEMKTSRDEIENRMKQRKVMLSLVPVITSSVLGLILRVIFSGNTNIVYMIIGMMSAVTATLNVIITSITNKDNSLKEYAQRMQRTIVCPRCGRPLSDYDIDNQICPACKSHA